MIKLKHYGFELFSKMIDNTLRQHEHVGRLKKDTTSCTYVQKSIFSFCSGLANQNGKSKKKGGGSQGGKWLQN